MADFGKVVPKIYTGTLSVNQLTGVVERNHYINQTAKTVYMRNRQGMVLPVAPKHNHLATNTDTSGLILSKSWQVNGKEASETFFNSLMHDNAVPDEIRNLARNGALTGCYNGYLFTVNYLLTSAELKTFSNVYVDGFDLVLANSVQELGDHPYMNAGRLALIEEHNQSGMFMSSIRIRCATRSNAVFWLACPNGAFSISAVYEPWFNEDTVHITYKGAEDRAPVNVVYSLDESLKGAVKLFRTREEALHFLNGDTNKVELIEAERQLKQLKIEHAAREAELANTRAKLEHEAKLETLALERKNTQSKGVVETLKMVPIVGTIFTMVGAFLAAIF